MSPYKLLKLLFIAIFLFAVGELFYTIQHYGFPKIELFKSIAGSCKILEEKFCSKGKFSYFENSMYVGFYLPADTIIFSPIDGRQNLLKIKQTNPVKGVQLSIFSESRNISYIFIGDIKGKDGFVKAGKTSSSIGNENIKNFGEYNLIFTINRFDPTMKKSLIDSDSLKLLFPRK